MALNQSRKLRAAVVSLFRCEKVTHKRLRGYLGASIIILSVIVVASVIFYLLFNFIMMILNAIDAAVENVDRSTYSLEIQRFDDEIHVEVQIDPRLQISHLFLTSPPGECKQRNTITDFKKGTEVFVEGDNCFVRFINDSIESYEKQIILFNTLDVNDEDAAPLQQWAAPVTYEAVQHLQFTDRLYNLLGREVAMQCNMHRLLWMLPAPPERVAQLAACRCFDTLHARINVCLQGKSELAERVHPWSLETEPPRTHTPTGPEIRPRPRRAARFPRSMDKILMKPADLGME